MVAKKDFYAPQHSEDVQVPNLEVLCLMKSFVSRGFCKTQFNWQWNYWYLTDEGIEYLREYLALPADIVPATHKAVAAPAPRGREFDGEKGKNVGPGGDFKPQYRE